MANDKGRTIRTYLGLASRVAAQAIQGGRLHDRLAGQGGGTNGGSSKSQRRGHDDQATLGMWLKSGCEMEGGRGRERRSKKEKMLRRFGRSSFGGPFFSIWP